MPDPTAPPTPPAGRPFVMSNNAMTADGKLSLASPGGMVIFGSPDDRAEMERLRALADAILIGGGSVRTEDAPLLIRDPAVQARRLATKGAPQALNVSAFSVLPPDLGDRRFFTCPDTERLVFTTARSTPEQIAGASRFARVEVVGADADGHVDLVEALARLKELGVDTLLLEGGGGLNFSMLRAGLVDEIHLTVCPFLFGGAGAPTPFDGAGLTREEIRRLRLRAHRVGGHGELFLVYDVLPGTATVTPSPRLGHGWQVS